MENNGFGSGYADRDWIKKESNCSKQNKNVISRLWASEIIAIGNYVQKSCGLSNC